MSGGSGGGGASGASGGGSSSGALIGAIVDFNGTYYPPFVSSVGSTPGNIVVEGAIPLWEVVVEQKTPKASGNGHLNKWESINSSIVSPLNSVAGFFEQGAIYGGRSISTSQAFNRRLLQETLSNVRIAKIAGRVSMVGNISQVGYALTNYLVNPSNGNLARLAAQGTIIAVEVGLNALVPGLGVLVGIGLNIFESSDYMQSFYNSLDE